MKQQKITEWIDNYLTSSPEPVKVLLAQLANLIDFRSYEGMKPAEHITTATLALARARQAELAVETGTYAEDFAKAVVTAVEGVRYYLKPIADRQVISPRLTAAQQVSMRQMDFQECAVKLRDELLRLSFAAKGAMIKAKAHAEAGKAMYTVSTTWETIAQKIGVESAKTARTHLKCARVSPKRKKGIVLDVTLAPEHLRPQLKSLLPRG